MFGCFQYSMATDSKSCIHLKGEHISADIHTSHVLFCSAYICLCQPIIKDEMEGACGMSGKEGKLHAGLWNLKETGPLENIGKGGWIVKMDLKDMRGHLQ
jgi:hypothetical protein